MRLTRVGQGAVLMGTVLLFAAAVFRDVFIGVVLSVLLVVVAAEGAWTALAARDPEKRLALRWAERAGRVTLYPGVESVRSATLSKSVGGTLELESRVNFQRIEPRRVRGTGERPVELRFRTDYAGEYSGEDVSARISGPLGFFTADARVRLPQRYLVYPHVVQVAANTARLMGLTGVGESPVEMPGAGGEFYELRDFHAGDDYRNVDWKATARRGELVVVERMKEVGSSFLLVLDARAPGFRETDALASTFLTLANSLGASGMSFGVLAHDGRRVTETSPLQEPGTALVAALRVALGVARVEPSPELLELVPLGVTSGFAAKALGADHPLDLLSELRRSELASLTREVDPWASAAKFVRDTQVRTVIYVSGVFEDLQPLIELAWEGRHYRDAEFVVANPCDAGGAEGGRGPGKTRRAMESAGVPYYTGSPTGISQAILTAPP